MVADAEKLHTPEEFATSPDTVTRRAELADGQIVGKHMGPGGMTPPDLVRSLIMTQIISTLGRFVADRNLGCILPLAPFLVGVNRNRVRRPDVAFIAGPIPTDPEKCVSWFRRWRSQ